VSCKAVSAAVADLTAASAACRVDTSVVAKMYACIAAIMARTRVTNTRATVAAAKTACGRHFPRFEVRTIAATIVTAIKTKRTRSKIKRGPPWWRVSRCFEALVSSPDKRRVLRLQPLAAVSARISAASALRDDPLEAQLPGLGEHERSLGHQGVGEQDVATPATSGDSAARRSSIGR
jgi:hypothetical protein